MPPYCLDSRNRGTRMARQKIAFREFGIPARIATFDSKERGEELVEEWAGRKNCYVSVYAFDEKKGEGSNYDSAIIETIWFDFDDDNDVTNCLKDVRNFYANYCHPRNITPRIYYTGGRGFQLNIDFAYLPLPFHIKRDAIRDYLTHLKNKYRLKTLDQKCINNSVTCLRRMVNTPYINKQTEEKNGRYCVQLGVEEMLSHTMEEIENLSSQPRNTDVFVDRMQNERAAKGLLQFVCNVLKIKYTTANSIHYLLDIINESDGSLSKYKPHKRGGYVYPVRPCVSKAIQAAIEKGQSDHTTNTIIATELINADWKDRDIAFVFSSIYEGESGNRWGWYKDNGEVGFQIQNLRAKAINRFSKNRLMQYKICKDRFCACGN